MEKDTKEQEVASLLKDMNGNSVREGDLVMVILDKPMVAGYVVAVKEPSLLVPNKQTQPGVVTIHGIVNIGFRSGQLTILGNVAKLVHPQSEAVVDAIAESVKKPRIFLTPQKESVNPTSKDAKPTDSPVPTTPEIVS